jgi:hypothetical protein
MHLLGEFNGRRHLHSYLDRNLMPNGTYNGIFSPSTYRHIYTKHPAYGSRRPRLLREDEGGSCSEAQHLCTAGRRRSSISCGAENFARPRGNPDAKIDSFAPNFLSYICFSSSSPIPSSSSPDSFGSRLRWW